MPFDLLQLGRAGILQKNELLTVLAIAQSILHTAAVEGNFPMRQRGSI
jgi:hypothetical protein